MDKDMDIGNTIGLGILGCCYLDLLRFRELSIIPIPMSTTPTFGSPNLLKAPNLQVCPGKAAGNKANCLSKSSMSTMDTAIGLSAGGTNAV
ncbi:hypothetical protein P154DRAFT_108614 [Amniculicola lignicola CBS 123094]|uniref:Uncharacterized protein n=1 Tax=Amniculicola lignicola CBS 123094 TaxID=1392246 RepID=A0A6A5WMR7_9PLEO|nr:hypothetical protein P154DRAFT_108614 [Amniculicola lignicola CBS 123094]